jgi:hypothetical protein
MCPQLLNYSSPRGRSSTWWYAILAVLSLGFLTFWFVFDSADEIPVRELTLTRMRGVQTRILEYARSHDQLPADLADLPQRQGYDDSITDAWGRKFIYNVDRSGTVTLKSLGRDGAPGGSGEDADIICKFQSRRPDGNWGK